ncbi:MAG: Hpt domain-containing protein, partial [Polaromonas sp.]|uniref:Hpt domain-containing protein n=1 Tax=Polaromonas sp. TaxID=1869339 RepID=UPI00403642D8
PIPVYAVHTGAAESRIAAAIHCDRPGLRVDIDLDRVSAADRAETAAALRQMLEALEAPPQAESVPPATAADHVLQGAAASDGPEPAWPEALAGLDLALGLRRAMGMKPLYMSLLGRYRDGRRDTPAQVRQALDAGDIKTAELLSHSLRGVSAQIGATRVPDDAQALEQAIHDGLPRASLDVLLARLESSLGELVAALDADLPPEPVRP